MRWAAPATQRSAFVYCMVGSRLPDHLYYFEGKDYSKVPSAADQIYFQQLMKEHVAEFLGAAGSRTLRQGTVVGALLVLSPPICYMTSYSNHVEY